MASTRARASVALALAGTLWGCPTASTPDVGVSAADAANMSAPDAELLPDAALPDAEPQPDAALPDAEPVDVGFALRGALRAGTTEAREGAATLRGRLSVTTSTRARTRTHSLQGGLGPLGY